MQIESFLKKLRHTDVAAQEGENFAWQNSRQESENPWMDFRFHVFGNAERKKSEFYKKNLRMDAELKHRENFWYKNSRTNHKIHGGILCSKNSAQPWSSGVSQPLD